MTPIRKSNKLNILKTKPLEGPNGELLVLDISDDEETGESQIREEVFKNVVEGHNGVQPFGNDVHLPQLDPVDHDFRTQNINEFLDELNEPDGTHVKVIDVLEELNLDGSNGEVVDMLEELNHNVFGSWLDVGCDSTEEDSDEEYYPTDSDYFENALDNDIDPKMVDEEVHNLEEKLQGTVLGNFMKGTTNVFEFEEMAKVSDSVEAFKRNYNDEHTCEVNVKNKFTQECLVYMLLQFLDQGGSSRQGAQDHNEVASQQQTPEQHARPEEPVEEGGKETLLHYNKNKHNVHHNKWNMKHHKQLKEGKHQKQKFNMKQQQQHQKNELEQGAQGQEEEEH
ncbi:hypothetical protein IFM89_003892 [Coptis chinensis]|uniref:Uncharacterized protein n=1 Tax=Coptis chinensis TaxID=261450 RepID=A0A835LWW1_9MAGN|nr:hypothetical protein IFM89_003892 [Coptis chinensis]